MPNLTRDPFHPAIRAGGQYGILYCTNFSELTVTVDGEVIEPWSIINVYTMTDKDDPHVVVFDHTTAGTILEVDGGYSCHEIHGKVEIQGNPKTCGCYNGRRSAAWFKRIDQRVNGW